MAFNSYAAVQDFNGGINFGSVSLCVFNVYELENSIRRSLRCKCFTTHTIPKFNLLNIKRVVVQETWQLLSQSINSFYFQKSTEDAGDVLDLDKSNFHVLIDMYSPCMDYLP